MKRVRLVVALAGDHAARGFYEYDDVDGAHASGPGVSRGRAYLGRGTTGTYRKPVKVAKLSA